MTERCSSRSSRSKPSSARSCRGGSPAQDAKGASLRHIAPPPCRSRLRIEARGDPVGLFPAIDDVLALSFSLSISETSTWKRADDPSNELSRKRGGPHRVRKPSQPQISAASGPTRCPRLQSKWPCHQLSSPPCPAWLQPASRQVGAPTVSFPFQGRGRSHNRGRQRLQKGQVLEQPRGGA